MSILETLPYLRGLVPRFIRNSPSFDPSGIHVIFVVGPMVEGQGLFHYFHETWPKPIEGIKKNMYVLKFGQTVFQPLATTHFCCLVKADGAWI